MIQKKCIIIPAYNEQENLGRVIAGIRSVFKGDIIVVDDGSEDSTSIEARRFGAHVIRHPFNLGYGVALQTGYKYALVQGYDYLLQMDADGQHNPANIPALFEKIENDDCDIVIGSRFLSDSYETGNLRMLAIKLFRIIILALTGERVSDPTSGYQAMNANVLNFFRKDFPYDYPDANTVILLHRSGFRIKELPVSMYPNSKGRSMHSGFFKISYYFFKIFLSITVTILKKKG